MIDYFKQMNAFFENDVAELYQLNNSEVALWCALAHINNKARGLQEFRVASSVLIRKSGLKEANFFKTRNSLNQKGLVIVKSGKGSTAATYQMKVLYDLSIYSVDNSIGNSNDNSSGNSIGNSNDNSSGNSSALSLNLTTPNLTKRTKKKKAVSKTRKRVYDHDSSAYKLAIYLFGKIKANNPNVKEMTEPELQSWANDSRLLLEKDKREKRTVQAVIDWCQADDFWKTNILSVSKLRKQFDQLALKMRISTKTEKRTVPPDNFDRQYTAEDGEW
jgi:hypothetical protein